MKIAQFTPSWERVPPPMSGGLELVIGLLINRQFTHRDEVLHIAWDDSIAATKLGSIQSQVRQLAAKSTELGISRDASVSSQASSGSIQDFGYFPTHTLS